MRGMWKWSELARKGNVAPSCLSLSLPEHPIRSVFPLQACCQALAKATYVMAGWLLIDWGKCVKFGVGQFAITWLWCKNQGIVQTLGYFGEGEERLGFTAVLHGHADQGSTREECST